MESSNDIWLCIVPVWFVCGLMAGALYRNKGRSELLGCLGGLLLGPIGLFFALVSSPNQDVLDQRARDKQLEMVRRGKLKKCPYCGEFIKPEATVCRFCTRELSSPAPAKAE